MGMNITELFHESAHYAISASGLYEFIDNKTWDALAAELGAEAQKLVEDRICERLTQIEAERQKEMAA